MSPTTRRTVWIALPFVLLTACGSEAAPRHAADGVTPSSAVPAVAESAEPKVELTGPVVDGTELSLGLGQTRHFWKTWVITYNSLERHITAGGDTPPGWNHQGPAWIAALTVRSLRKHPVRIRPTLTVQSDEGVQGTFGGFLGYSGETELKPTDRLRLRALVGTQSTNSISLTLDLGISSQPQISLVGGGVARGTAE